MASGALSVSIGGSAAVFCVHNREKRQVTELQFDAAATSVHMCACCENLFPEPTDQPMFCPTCRGQNVYKLGGPLPDPIGRI
jgi:hypothetical protein